jgi:hypothetical protein
VLSVTGLFDFVRAVVGIESGLRPADDASTHQIITVDRVAHWKDRWDVMGIFLPGYDAAEP